MMSVYDKKYRRTAFLNNEAEDGIHFDDDELTTDIQSGMYKLDLKVPKDTPLAGNIEEGFYIETFTPQGKQLLLNITEITENSQYKAIYCEDSSVLALNSFVEPTEAPKSKERADYYLRHTLENIDLEIKANECDTELLLTFSNSQRVLQRLQEIAKAFALELLFEVDFVPGQKPKRYVSLLKQRVEDYKGFRISSDDLLLGIERRVNTTNIVSRILVKGKQMQTVQAPTNATKTPVTAEPAKDTFVEKVVEKAFAIKALGRRYQWGGNGNPSWDCSGFMQACFEAAGIVAGHRWTTYSMWAGTGGKFKRITKSELKRGDMILYDTGYTTPGDVNHVGLYLGPTLSSPNSVIHAGDPVGKTQRADSMTIIGYVRVVR